MFQFDKHLRLPYPNMKFIPTSNQIEFVADSLTPEEQKVFAAWEQNAKNNPVK